MDEFYTDVQKSRNDLLVRGYRDGVRFQEKVHYEPSLFAYTDKPSGWTDIHGDHVERIVFDSMSEAKKLQTTETICGMGNFVYPYINERWPFAIRKAPEDVKIGVFDIEVGSDDGFPNQWVAMKPVTAITLYVNKKYLVFTCGEREFKPHRDDIVHIHSKDEKRLLEKFVQVWEHVDMDIISGWSCENFDIPYMINRIKRVLGDEWAKRLSPWGQIRETEKFDKFGKQVTIYHIVGMAVIDYELVYRKHAYITHENYKLDTVAFDDLGVNKTDYSEYKNLHMFYEQNFQKFVEYNVRDVELINLLDAMHGLFYLVVMFCYDSKINFSDVYASVRLWDTIIHNELWKDNICVSPDVGDEPLESDFIGAFVKDPEPGCFLMMECHDFTSLYPSTAVQANISPETFVEELDIGDLMGTALHVESGRICITTEDVLNGFFDKNPALVERMKRENLSLTANGCLWSRDKQGVLPRIIKRIMIERADFKKKMTHAKEQLEKTKDEKTWKPEISKWKILQNVRKIQLNSLYGCLGNKFFRWFTIFAAEGITTTGQLSIRWVEHWVNAFLNEKLGTEDLDFVVAIDTDSVYITLAKFVDPSLTRRPACEAALAFSEANIEPIIAAQNIALGDLLNVYEHFVKMKRESVSDKGIWTAKKRYVLNVYYDEGVWKNEPELKITGIQAIQTSTPKICREKIKEGLKIIMGRTQEEFWDFVEDFRKDFYEQPFHAIAKPSSVNNVKKYTPAGNTWMKHTPIHVRGAIVFNRLLEKHDLYAKYDKISDGDKIRYGYLELPNHTHSNIIAVPDVLPEEFNLDQFVDYDAMFEKTFMSPFEPIVKAHNWKTEKRISVFEEAEGLFE